MPLLGRAKTTLGTQIDSQATTGAGKQNILCAYLSVAVLLGLATNLFWDWWWADPAVALLVAAACLQARWATWRGQPCADDLTAC